MEVAEIVHTTHGRPKTKSRRNAADQDMTEARGTGQDIFVHGAQGDRREKRRKCWYLWSPKEGTEEVSNKLETETDEEDQTTTQDFVNSKYRKTHAFFRAYDIVGDWKQWCRDSIVTVGSDSLPEPNGVGRDRKAASTGLWDGARGFPADPTPQTAHLAEAQRHFLRLVFGFFA